MSKQQKGIQHVGQAYKIQGVSKVTLDETNQTIEIYCFLLIHRAILLKHPVLYTSKKITSI